MRGWGGDGGRVWAGWDRGLIVYNPGLAAFSVIRWCFCLVSHFSFYILLSSLPRISSRSSIFIPPRHPLPLSPHGNYTAPLSYQLIYLAYPPSVI